MAESAYKKWRSRLPERIGTRSGRCQAWIDALVVDHGFLRPFFNQPFEVTPGVWRSNQPTPGRLRKLHAEQGLASVLNLRGASDRGAYVLERQACQMLGIELIDLQLSSRRPPRLEQLAELLDILDSAPRPLLIHCKSGADRAGLVSAMVLHGAGGSAEAVRNQLSFRYWHIRAAETGVLDYFLDQYLIRHKLDGLALREWIESDYDREVIRREYRPGFWASWLVNKILRRE